MAFMLREKRMTWTLWLAQYNLIHLWQYRAISNAFDLDSVGFFLGRTLSTMKSGSVPVALWRVNDHKR
ncbi:hypothetical protein NC653_007233 [Populus alba x Populus x berolinensis]|uniref:Uncharacterized protein n=1 Tax=Populus alba x Populus x berolinensis TaxID=444605 RepID=A0AAD6WFG3_9ROSI|nr:hypothetical protein NC653_007233 [Populus alba x Populus x berolinensis]